MFAAPTNRLRHLANLITLTRILGVGVIFWLTPYSNNFLQLIVIHIYTLICITDFLDGWIARKLHIVSDLGSILDPLADKILVLVFLPLLEMQVINSFAVFIILSREFAIMALRVVSAREGGSVIPATISGKLKTALTLPICGILLARVPVTEVGHLPKLFLPIEWIRRWVITWPQWSITMLIYLMVAVTLWSFFDYFGAYIWQQYVKRWGGDERKAKRAVRSLVPNTFSMLNLSFGILAVLSAWLEEYHTAVLFVLFGIMLDAVDGSIARKLDAQSTFGAKLDSRADFISFGLAPAVVIFRLLLDRSSDLLHPLYGLSLAIAYYASVHYRLRRFDRSGHSPYFDGLPSPVAAATVVIAAISQFFSNPWAFSGLVVLVGLLMISRIPYAHLDIARKKRFFRVMLMLAFIFTMLTIMNLLNLAYAQDIYAHEILFALICVYLLSPLGGLVFRLFRKRGQVNDETCN